MATSSGWRKSLGTVFLAILKLMAISCTDFPCAANSCMVFTVVLLIMAASWEYVDQHFPQTTAISGVGQFYLGAIIHRRSYLEGIARIIRIFLCKLLRNPEVEFAGFSQPKMRKPGSVQWVSLSRVPVEARSGRKP